MGKKKHEVKKTDHGEEYARHRVAHCPLKKAFASAGQVKQVQVAQGKN